MEPYTFGYSEKIVNIVASGGKICELHDRPGFLFTLKCYFRLYHLYYYLFCCEFVLIPHV